MWFSFSKPKDIHSPGHTTGWLMWIRFCRFVSSTWAMHSHSQLLLHRDADKPKVNVIQSNILCGEVVEFWWNFNTNWVTNTFPQEGGGGKQQRLIAEASDWVGVFNSIYILCIKYCALKGNLLVIEMCPQTATKQGFYIPSEGQITSVYSTSQQKG